MTPHTESRLKKYTVLIGLLLIFLMLFYGLSYLNRKNRVRVLAESALVLCRSHPAFSAASIEINGLADPAVSNLPFHTVLTAVFDGKDALIFFLPLAGKYGRYPAVFVYEQSMGCVFCGLAGVHNREAGYYGITQALITLQCKKIETIMGENTR
ncbi:MAG: hypothetical protein P1P65_03105 [Treponema sp.]